MKYTFSGKKYFPFAFRHDTLHPLADEVISRLEERMNWLNLCWSASGLDGHVFAAAIAAYAKTIPLATVENSGAPTVWEALMNKFNVDQVAELAKALSPNFTDAKPRLEFPNAVALVDCRFVTTKEWEFLRRYSIGGSEVAAIMGKSHYATPLKLYHDKRGEIPDVVDNSREYMFDYGHCVENFVVEKVCALLGAVHYPEFRMFCHKEYAFITANPDAILMFPDGSLALFEAKTATRFKKDDWADGIPEYYAPQPQQYLAVLDDPRLEKGYIGVVLGGLPANFQAHLYMRDREMAAEQIRQIVDFWTNCMEKETPPALSGDPKLDIEAIYCAGDRQMFQDEISLPSYTVDEFGAYFDMKNSRQKIMKKVNELKAQEDLMVADIIQNFSLDVPVLCKMKNGMTYRIRRQKVSAESVDLDVLPPAVIQQLREAALRSASPALGYTNPKLSVK